MPKELENKLRIEADKKGLSGDRKNAYIYSTLRKTGWVPSTQSSPKEKANKIFNKHIK